MENLDKQKVIGYANILLPKIQEAINDGEFGENVSTNELLLALGAILPQAIYESSHTTEDEEAEVSLLEMNHIINELLFELK